MSGGGQNTNTIQSTPAWLTPYFQSALNAGQNLLTSGGPQYYPGQTVAPFNPVQEQGIQSGIDVASAPNASQGAQGANLWETSGALLDPSQNGYMQAINQAGMGPSALPGAIGANNFLTSGALLNPSSNPWLQGTFNQAAGGVRNQLESEFAGAGSNVLNSAPVQADQLNNLANQVFGGAYQQGVNQMGQAAANAPGLVNAQYTPAQLYGQAYGQGLQYQTQAQALAPSIDQGTYLPSQYLDQTGAGIQNQTQNLINANQNMWNYNQQMPYNQLSWYSGLLGSNASPYKSASSVATMPNNGTTSGLGGAAAGAAAGSSFGPYGAAIGGLAGGLLGAFG